MSNSLLVSLEIARRIVRDRSNAGERARRLVAFVRWQIEKRLRGRTLEIRLFNGYKFLAVPDDEVSAALIYHRIPDFDEISLIRRHIHSGTLVDVGANVGSFSLLLADRVQHAILFEPNPAAAARAQQNLAINDLHFDVVVKALSDAAGQIEFEDRGGASSTNRTITDRVTTSFPVRQVDRTTLDQFVQDSPPPVPISIVKIDVEGHENEAIRGMKQCLATWRPLVMFEYLQRTDITVTRELFAASGYVITEIDDGSLRVAPAAVASQQNLFVIPEEQLSAFLTPIRPN